MNPIPPGAVSAGADAHWTARMAEAFDLLATMIAVVRPDGHCQYANTAFENVLGLSRRNVLRRDWFDWFIEADLLRDTVAAVANNEFATSRLDAQLRRSAGSTSGTGSTGGTGTGHPEPLLVHVIVNQIDGPHVPGEEAVLVELIEIEQQTRQDREERALDQVQANKELIRNLAHEIKNPLGGIRGAAQLLEMEIAAQLSEYTQVIIHEADRLQVLVDRLLAPHRRPQQVVEMNIHEVCERVRSLVLAEFPRGLRIERDYDTSIPDFLGDREQLIQAVLNIVQNAAQALQPSIAAGDGRIVLRTRVARQATVGKHRHRLALELHIEDNGPGIPESIRDRIFYPLVSGRDGGSGLGLDTGADLRDPAPGHDRLRK